MTKNKKKTVKSNHKQQKQTKCNPKLANTPKRRPRPPQKHPKAPKIFPDPPKTSSKPSPNPPKTLPSPLNKEFLVKPLTRNSLLRLFQHPLTRNFLVNGLPQ